MYDKPATPARRRPFKLLVTLLSVITLFALVFVPNAAGARAKKTKPAAAAAVAAPTPGTGGPPQVVHFGSILPIVQETGFISLSQNATGTNSAAGADVAIEKPAGATVRSAFLSAATTGFSGATLAAGDITLDGQGVAFSVTTPNAIGSNNYWGEVTSLVKSKLDSASAGTVNFHVTEHFPGNVDGEVLTVIFNDPNQASSNTIALLFGAQNVAGDTFNVGLATPIDKTDPNLRLDMGLGISFSFQSNGTQQFSTIDVNGNAVSKAAGGEDDGASANGALITVGGVGDSNANPADPNATPTNPRSDDELYSLLPFVNNGDTGIQVQTRNPSNDDNIFYASLVLNSTTAVVGEGIVLAPIDATNPINTNHTVTATVQDDNGDPIANRSVTFKVIQGPNAGLTGTATTDAEGKASFTYSSTVVGVDEIQASFLNSADSPVLSNVVRKEWTDGGPPPVDTTPPVCSLLTASSSGITVRTVDVGSGLASIEATIHRNADVAVPAFTAGTTAEVVVTATKIKLDTGASVELTVKDVAGNVTVCDPVLARISAGETRTFAGVPAAEHYISISDAAGVAAVAVEVNGVDHIIWDPNGKTVDLGGLGADSNTMKVRVLGLAGSSASIMIWDGK